MQYGSDLIWGKWVEGNTNVKNLRVYAVNNVLNDETTAIVSRAMRNKLVSNLAVWPGTVFDKDKDSVDFQALIGKLAFASCHSKTVLTTTQAHQLAAQYLSSLRNTSEFISLACSNCADYFQG